MRRSLGLFDVTCIGLNAIVGSGIFLLPDDLYREMGCALAARVPAVRGGALAGRAVLRGSREHSDRTGGPYLYASEAFGPRIGFGVGWMCFANAVFSFAAVASAAAAYCGRARSRARAAGRPEGRGAAGDRRFRRAQLPRREAGRARGRPVHDRQVRGADRAGRGAAARRLERATARGPLPHGLSGIGSATFMALFAAQGFEVVPVPAGETRSPQRDLPIAIVGSLARRVAAVPARAGRARRLVRPASAAKATRRSPTRRSRSRPALGLAGRGGRADLDARLRVRQRARHAALPVRGRADGHLPRALARGPPALRVAARCAWSRPRLLAIALVIPSTTAR